MSSEQEKVVIVDGYSFLFRAYHSMPPLTNPEGIPVGAVYGFTSMLMRLLKDIDPSHIVVVFDSGKKNFRHDIYPEYKANRPEAPEDLRPQFPLVREAAKALNISTLEIEGYEADDIIATLAKRAIENKEEVLIVSSDKDLMQLVNSHTKMYDAIRGKVLGPEEVKEKWGVPPELMLDMLAMVGDSSDNIPGLPGIGPKTAALLLNQYNSWDSVLNSASEIKQNKRREVIQSGSEIVKLSKSLIKLKDDLHLEASFEDLRSQLINQSHLLSFLEKHNFKSLIARSQKDIKNHASVSANSEQTAKKELAKRFPKVIKITESRDLAAFIEKISSECEVSIFLQSNFKRVNEVRKAEDINSIVVGSSAKSAFIQVGSVASEKQRSFLEAEQNNGIPLDEIFNKLDSILNNIQIKKIVYDVKSLLHILDVYNLAASMNGYDDVMLMSYSAGSGRLSYDFNGLCQFYLEKKDRLIDIGGITKSRKQLEEFDESYLSEYFSEKMHMLFDLYSMVKEELISNKKYHIYQKLELPLARTLFEMEKIGVKIDARLLGDLSKKIESILEVLEKEIYQLAGTEFNIASPKQLSEVLFERMNIEHPKKSKSGSQSTSVEILEQLKISGHNIAEKLLEWRSLYKLKTTYTDALPKQIDPRTGRVHTEFRQAVTSTGRLSSTDPNLQNIPIRSDLGQQVRKTFVAGEGYKIISLDYSQIELRIVAHIADVESLKDAFKKDIDIHQATASEVFDVELSKVTSDLRRKAKAINFGILYGLSAFGLAKNIDIAKGEAALYIKKYFNEYPGIKEYMDQTINFAKSHGFVETIMGRRCYMKNINDKNYQLRSFAERAAINAPIQGSNADFIKKAMNEISSKFDSKQDIKMILQVHDELLFEVADDQVEFYKNKLIKIMEQVVCLDVPIKVDAFVGKSWNK